MTTNLDSREYAAGLKMVMMIWMAHMRKMCERETEDIIHEGKENINMESADEDSSDHTKQPVTMY